MLNAIKILSETTEFAGTGVCDTLGFFRSHLALFDGQRGLFESRIDLFRVGEDVWFLGLNGGWGETGESVGKSDGDREGGFEKGQFTFGGICPL